MPEACERRNSVHVGPARRGSRIQALAEQDRPDGRGRDADAELQQLSADALVAPPGILGAKANDEGADLGVDRWPAGAPSPFVCPISADELPVPAEQGLGPDNERRPLASGHRLARRRQQEPIETAQTGPLHLALQHPHLVAKHQELDLLPSREYRPVLRMQPTMK